MISVTRYRQITGDHGSTDAEVTRCVADAVDLLEEVLDRPLASAERTENMRPDRLGRLWPRATPIAEADTYEIDGLALTGASPFGPAVGFLDPSTFLAVTYTGGWTDERPEEYDPEDAANVPLPYCIARDLAWAAYRLAHPEGAQTATGFPAGATSVRLGDASVSFGAAGPATAGDTSAWWTKATKGYRYAPIHSGPDAYAVSH